jgi:hypothetical protein
MTDWFPSLLQLASDGSWTGSTSGSEDIDGIDVFDSFVNGGNTLISFRISFNLLPYFR